MGHEVNDSAKYWQGTLDEFGEITSLTCICEEAVCLPDQLIFLFLYNVLTSVLNTQESIARFPEEQPGPAPHSTDIDLPEEPDSEMGEGGK